MNFTSGCVDRVVFVCWHGTPQVADAESIVSLLAHERRRSPSPLVFCTILSDRVGAPSAALRARMGEFAKRFREHCGSIHLVVVGEGVGRSLLRTVIRAVLVASRQTGRVSVHDTVEEAVASARDALTAEPGAIVDEARGRRIF